MRYCSHPDYRFFLVTMMKSNTTTQKYFGQKLIFILQSIKSYVIVVVV